MDGNGPIYLICFLCTSYNFILSCFANLNGRHEPEPGRVPWFERWAKATLSQELWHLIFKEVRAFASLRCCNLGKVWWTNNMWSTTMFNSANRNPCLGVLVGCHDGTPKQARNLRDWTQSTWSLESIRGANVKSKLSHTNKLPKQGNKGCNIFILILMVQEGEKHLAKTLQSLQSCKKSKRSLWLPAAKHFHPVWGSKSSIIQVLSLLPTRSCHLTTSTLAATCRLQKWRKTPKSGIHPQSLFWQVCLELAAWELVSSWPLMDAACFWQMRRPV